MNRYDAFISYSHQADDDVAPAIERALNRLGKPWYRRRAMRVYRDRTGMAANPDLWAAIQAALDESRWFVLLASPEAADSSWVGREVDHWRSKHGDDGEQRMVVVVTAGSWDWDDEADDFNWDRSSALPRSLSGAFKSVPAIVSLVPEEDYAEADLDDPRFRSQMASVAAAIRDVPKDVLEGEDLHQHRRTMRVAWGAAVGFAALALVASAAGISALANASQARADRSEARRSEARAQAQADAAEAVLAAMDSPALAIELALEAARRSDSPTVRSAMLAVSQEARRLVRALEYPEDAAGQPLSDAAFSLDGTRLMAWGPSQDEGRSYLQVWRLDRVGTVFSGMVDVRVLQQVVALGDDTVAACTDRGPATIRFGDDSASLNVLDDDWDVQATSCSLVEFAGGVVFQHAPRSSRGDRALYLDRRGTATTVEAVDTVSAHFGSQSALLTGPGGITVASPDGVQHVSATPTHVSRYGDARGRFLVGLERARWALVEPSIAGHQIRELPVPPSAVDVVPIIDYEGLSADAAWVTADEIVGWTRGPQTIQVRDTQIDPRFAGTGVHLEPLSNTRFVVVVGNTATILDAPTTPSLAQALGRSAGWVPTTIDAAVGSMDTMTATEAIAGRCANHHRVVLNADDPVHGHLVIGDALEPVRLEGGALLTDDCKLLDVGESLSAFDQSGEASLIRGEYVADGLAVSPATNEVAIVRAGRPVEVLSIAPTADLARPWTFQDAPADPLADAFGERTVYVRGNANDVELVVAERTGEIASVPLPSDAALVATRPDGAAGLVETPAGERLLVAIDGDIGQVDPACRSGDIHYVPGADFTSEIRAAEAQVPVVQREDGAVDCRDGSRHNLGRAPLEVLSYEIASDKGRLVTRRPGRSPTVTTWQRAEPASIRSIEAPAGSDDTVYRFDERADHLVTREPGSRGLTVYRRHDGGWSIAATVASGLGTIADAALVDQGTLLLVVADSGGFELFDTLTGRRVTYDIEPVRGPRRVRSISSARVVNHHLYANLDARYDTTGTSIVAGLDIPVGIQALTYQLCELYRAPSCPT